MKIKIFTFLLILLTSGVMAQETVFSGSFGEEGDNLYWVFNSHDSLLTISGTGNMEDFYDDCGLYNPGSAGDPIPADAPSRSRKILMGSYAPWYSYRLGIRSVVIEEGVTNISEFAFCQCNNLLHVTIPTSVTRIHADAFYYCVSLTQAPIGEGVTNLYAYAFEACQGLTSVTIPSSVRTIGDWAFVHCGTSTGCMPSGPGSNDPALSPDKRALSSCADITEVTCLATTPPSMGSGVFDGTDKNIPVYVPAESVAAYRAATGWNEFLNIQPIGGEWNPEHPNNPGNYRLTLEANDTLKGHVVGAGLYEQGASVRIKAIPENGYKFVFWSDGDSSAVRDIVLTRDCTLLAWFEERSYMIEFRNYDNSLLTYTYENYGSIPTYRGATPTRPNSDTYEYVFAGWEPALHAVRQDTVYRAVYDAIFLGDPIVYVDWDSDITELAVGRNSHVIVNPYSHLTVSQPTTIKSLTIRKDTMCGQVSNIENLTVENLVLEQSFASYTQPISSRWFAFSVPFEMSVASGFRKVGDEHPAVYGVDFVLDEYSGALRADTQDGWRRVSATDSLYPGKLYMLASQEATQWQFVASQLHGLSERWSVWVSAFPSNIGAHHAGWNGIANPSFVEAYAYCSSAPYATYFDNYYGVYRVVQLTSDYLWRVGNPFFVQTSTDNHVYFAPEGSLMGGGSIDSEPAWVPSGRTSTQDKQPFSIALSNASGSYTDEAFVKIVSEKNEGYIIGEDLEKLQVKAPSVPQVWVDAYGTRLAAYAMPMSTEEGTLSLGLYAPQDGRYSLSVNNMPSDVSIELTINGERTELSNGACEIMLNEGINEGCSMNIHHTPQTTTGIEEPESTSTIARKILRDGQILIIRSDKLYTTDGKMIIER